MRIRHLLLTATAAIALAGCKSAEPPSLELCGLGCPEPTKPAPTTTTTDTDTTGGGTTNGGTEGVGTTGVNTTSNTGNTASLSASDATVDKAFAYELTNYLRPQNGEASSLARLTEKPGTSGVFTKDVSTAAIEIDTKTQSNSNWPKSKDMTLFREEAALDGATYREYHYYDAPLNGQVIDEELQVWDWGTSKAYQYRHVPGGGEAFNQLWGYTGTKTAVASMPANGSATYNGSFVATAKTKNWRENGTPPVAINNLWRVNGDSTINADFATGAVTGTLTSTRWIARNNDGVFTTVMSGDIANPNHKKFMTDDITLRGTITGNTYTGTAHMPTLEYLNSDNHVEGAFFGATPTDTTGIFTTKGTLVDPTGGSTTINDDGRATIDISGAYHGQQ